MIVGGRPLKRKFCI